MSDEFKIIILGASGAGKVVAETIEDINSINKQWKLLGYLDDTPSLQNSTINGVDVIGTLDDHSAYDEAYFIFTIGNPRNYVLKNKIITKLHIPIEKYAKIIHPTSYVSRYSNIGFGSFIGPNACIGPNVIIGNNVYVHSNVYIAHDSAVGNNSIITNSVSIAGNVDIKENVYLGANSSMRDYLTIGKYSQVGMGAVVLNNVEENTVVVGNPARFLRKVTLL